LISMFMRFLLISDTHGKLGIINDLAAAQVGADNLIDASVFGFKIWIQFTPIATGLVNKEF